MTCKKVLIVAMHSGGHLGLGNSGLHVTRQPNLNFKLKVAASSSSSHGTRVCTHWYHSPGHWHGAHSESDHDDFKVDH